MTRPSYTSPTSDRNKPDAIDALVCSLVVGMGLASLFLALGSNSLDTRSEEAAKLLHEHAARIEGPVLVTTPLEALVVEPGNDPSLPPLRLITSHRAPQLSQQRTWVLALSGRSPTPPKGVDVQVLGQRGGVTLEAWVWRSPGQKVLLSALLEDADVALIDTESSKATSCGPWRFGRIHCGPHPWNWIGPTELFIRGKPERCIWAHPLAGHELSIHFPALPRGSALNGRYALSDGIANGPGSPVTLRLVQGGDERLKRTQPNRPGWGYFTLPLDPATTSDLTVHISAPDDGQRHFCFDGELTMEFNGD